MRGSLFLFEREGLVLKGLFEKLTQVFACCLGVFPSPDAAIRRIQFVQRCKGVFATLAGAHSDGRVNKIKVFVTHAVAHSGGNLLGNSVGLRSTNTKRKAAAPSAEI